MRKIIITLVVAATSLVPVWLRADGMPPSSEKAAAKTGSEAPAPASSRVAVSDLQPDAPDTYTVQKGDTLWGIAGRFLKDPWKWPQIWQMNRDQIKDPHWIYPGNVIRLDKTAAGGPQLSLEGGASGGTEAEAAANVVKLDPRIRVEPLQTAIPSIPASAIGPFLTQPLVVDAAFIDNAPVIVATEESRVILGSGDQAYADRIGTDAAVNWQIFRPAAALRDPENGELLGYEAKYIGDARVRRFGNPSTLVITKAREEVNRGDKLMPAREVSTINYVPRAPDKPIRGVIMSVDGGVSEVGQYQIVTINRGSRDGIEVGNVLAVYRQPQPMTAGTSRSSGDYFSSAGSWFRRLVKSDDNAKAGERLEGRAITLPEERNGLLFVFRVFEKMSYAMVMKATRPIYLGDVVRSP